ncbi:hypothetical protein [Rivularia sp. UHCC 0363]|uniref:hypothetical protein n=1 Tax=Rivularia sp. UHCC 0363 TaxID=3110244 RepID=UPI002B20A8CF|nr:hypothetical protein [Rivularia sp. UHCC 0363]MEA5597089.1 hypothetical protein [Rivularia sp. UHCC 0363]
MTFSVNPDLYKNHSPEQQIYQHLFELVQLKSVSETIECFRDLFIEGTNYVEKEISSALEEITASKKAEKEFYLFLNRCCYILINRWYMQPQMHYAIYQLIAIFNHPSRRILTSRSKSSRRLHVLVKGFINSEQYSTLQRLAQVINQTTHSESHDRNQPLTALIRRYPYLYEHCLLNEDATIEQQWIVKQIQSQVQRKFEIDLSQYVTYQVRLAQVAANNSSLSGTNRIIHPVNNPTLLSDTQVNIALKNFLGKVEGENTYKDLAHNFLHYSSQATCFRAFKDDLYEYLISGIDWEYGKLQFHQRLYAQLQNSLPQADFQKVNDFLIVRTCQKLLNFLIVETSSSPQHFTFLDLIGNQGSICAIGLLLKIILICRKIKPYLAKRVAILFNHYEFANDHNIDWFVALLEELNIALSIHFGNIDLCYFK